MVTTFVLTVMVCMSIFITYLYLYGLPAQLAYGAADRHLDLAVLCLAVPGIGGLSFLAARARPLPELPRRPAAAQTPTLAEPADHISVLVARRDLCAQIEAVLAKPEKAVLLKLEVDDFRQLRNLHGSAVMEALLSNITMRLRRLAPPGAIVATMLAEEFAVLLPCEDAAQATREGNRLLQGLCGTYILGAHSLDVSVSAGAALLPGHATTADAALRAGRLALLQAKTAGGRGWRVFNPGMGIAAEALQELQAELRGAISGGQIVPFYQPVVSLATNRIVGFEVLARWQHPRRGLLPPDQFIPIAEQQRLCADLTLALLRQVSIDARAWPDDYTFAFNASPTQLRDLLHFVSNPDAMRDTMVDPRRIELEVTETVLIDDMELAREVVRAMHRSGAKVVLDDFGTGYANFFQLRELPFDRVKIDRTFVKDMMISQRTNACVRAMLALARTLGATVIAEGVETEAAAAHLRAMGCDFAQGFHYAPPVAASAVPALRQGAAA
jgi:predicted signal transduction protein with EAL and GGDEF domain